MTPYCFVTLVCEEKFLLLSFRLFIFFFCKTRLLLEGAYFWRALTFGQNLVGLKNYAYYRITLTFGSRLLSELYGNFVFFIIHGYFLHDLLQNRVKRNEGQMNRCVTRYYLFVK